MKKIFLALTTALLQLGSISLPAKCMQPRSNVENRSEGSYRGSAALDLSNLPSIITSEEITLTKLTNEDVESLAQLVLDGGVGQFFLFCVPTTYSLKQDVIDCVVLLNEEDQKYENYVIRNSCNEPLGEISVAFDQESSDCCINLIYWVASNSRGHGYASKASILLIDQILSLYQVKEARIGTVMDNIASTKTIEKVINHEKILGLLKSYEVFEKEIRGAILPDDNLDDDAKTTGQSCDEPDMILIDIQILSHVIWTEKYGEKMVSDFSKERQYDSRMVRKTTISNEVKMKDEFSWVIKDYVLHF